jgi:FAD-dependent urate hydroxylase
MHTNETVAVVGAGPYGLATTSYLRSAGIETRLFGEPMSFWADHMPKGMVLRSPRSASSIGHPEDLLTLEAFEHARGRRPAPDTAIPLEDFVAYGRWFQSRVVPDVERTQVTRVSHDGRGFQVETAHGGVARADRVVVAAGISEFAWWPRAFRGLPSQLVSHASEHHDLAPFAGRSVAVVGAGQSALETAALLDAAGADVRVVVRRPHVHWRRRWFVRPPLNLVGRMVYSPSQVGPAGICLITDAPHTFRRLPERVQWAIERRSMRPEADMPLRSRLEHKILAGRTVERAAASSDGVRVWLDDGATRDYEHVVLATGYRIDMAGYRFLAPELVAAMRQRNGYPLLDGGFQTSVPGLHVLGAPAAASFGPLMRFIAGSRFAASAVARTAVAGLRIPAPAATPEQPLAATPA